MSGVHAARISLAAKVVQDTSGWYGPNHSFIPDHMGESCLLADPDPAIAPVITATQPNPASLIVLNVGRQACPSIMPVDEATMASLQVALPSVSNQGNARAVTTPALARAERIGTSELSILSCVADFYADVLECLIIHCFTYLSIHCYKSVTDSGH
jgi:hypothetical protein